MIFHNENERIQHPQARLIPLSVWKQFYYEDGLSSLQLTLMQAPSSDLGHYLAGLDDVALQALTARDKNTDWLAMAYGHPDITDDLLMDFAGRLNLSSEEVFELAAIIGKLSLMERIMELAPDKVHDMISVGNRFGSYESFRAAAEYGHLPVMERLMELAPDKVQAMISENKYGAFREAAQNGHLPVMERLMELATDKVQDMIAAENYGAFRGAAKNGHLPVMERLIELATDKVQDMISAGDYAAFWGAAFNGHLPVMERLMELAPDKMQDMVSAKVYGGFRFAAQNGHLPVMERFIQLAPDKVQDMVSADDYDAFRDAAKNGHLPVMECLMELAPDKVQDMISAWSYDAFGVAARNGHLPVMERLIEKLTELAPDKVQDMISAANYYAFRGAAENGNLPVVHRLLPFPFVFAYAEMHDREYGGRYIHPFVIARMRTLQEARASFERDNPQAVFDIGDPEEAKLCFYMLRNLIRRNDPALLDDMRLLIEIPSVKALLHTAVTLNQPNELFRLALSLGNQAAAEVLLTVPAIHELATTHDFYRQEARGDLDLNALARDRESSMTALTQGEQKRLDAAIKAYNPMIKERGIDSLMTELRDRLILRYKTNPALVHTGDGRVIKLPASWDEWCALRGHFSNDTQELALKAYAQNKDHSAWRYLEKPNPWMAENAPYVHRNEQGGYSTFEEYQPLITLLYLGASDATTAPCDGHTLETRLEHFIDELAHIGRAHNWDETRIKTNESGEPVVDEFGQVITEEYDDLEGDKPSCYSGVKRRLFQSVLGHPLFKLLTLDDVKQELREFVRGHFQQCIQDNPETAIEWKKAWDKVCEGDGGVEEEGVLSALNITEVDQTAFIERLGEKYSAQFNEDPSFKTYIQDRFKLTEHISTHAARFGGETGLIGLLATIPLTQEMVSAKRLRMFDADPASSKKLKHAGDDDNNDASTAAP